jgi:histidine triad (HIT) family protein
MCVFCEIVAKTISSKVVFENDEFLAFHDVNPISPIHVLVVPKEHVPSLASADLDHEALVGRLLITAKRVAELISGTALGYRVVINTGALAGQSVGHLHAHILAGRPLGWPPG